MYRSLNHPASGNGAIALLLDAVPALCLSRAVDMAD